MLTAEWTDDLASADHDPDWHWRGLLAARQITLLTGVWKTGKTTLLSHLLHRRTPAARYWTCRYGPERLRSLPRRIAPTGARAWNACRWGRTSASSFDRSWAGPRAQFDDLITQLLQLQHQRGVDLIALDPLACSAPR
jgi:hypothetical protein